ncbi:MAG: DNA polymerase III subunit delta [Rhodoglobus sp.]
MANRIAIPQLGYTKIRPAPVVLVSGTEGVLADRAIRALRDILKAEDPDLEIHDVQADQYSSGELMTVASPSLFHEARLIRVANVEKCTDAFIADTISYLAHPAPDVYLLLRHAGGVRGKKLLDSIRGGLGGGVEVSCLELKKENEKSQFAASEFSAAGRRITVEALRMLVRAFAEDLAELASACQQLLADNGGDITEAIVERYYSGRVETNAFAVADAAIAGRTGDALILLRHAVFSGADPVPIVAAFAAKLRVMATISTPSSAAPGRLAQSSGLAPWQVDRARRDLQGWNDSGLARCIETIAATDAQVKGGGRDPIFALEYLVRVIAHRGI